MSEKKPQQSNSLRSRKPSKKKIVEKLDQYLAPQQKFVRPKAPRKKRIKLVELDTPTFGPLLPHGYGTAYGFVYKVSVTTSIGTRYYIGSKSFDKAGVWKVYCTSSEIVQRLIATSRVLPDACRVSYEILELVPTEAMLKIREDVRIRGLYLMAGKDRTINIATPFGISLRTGKSLRK